MLAIKKVNWVIDKSNKANGMYTNKVRLNLINSCKPFASGFNCGDRIFRFRTMNRPETHDDSHFIGIHGWHEFIVCTFLCCCCCFSLHSFILLNKHAEMHVQKYQVNSSLAMRFNRECTSFWNWSKDRLEDNQTEKMWAYLFTVWLEHGHAFCSRWCNETKDTESI